MRADDPLHFDVLEQIKKRWSKFQDQKVTKRPLWIEIAEFITEKYPDKPKVYWQIENIWKDKKSEYLERIDLRKQSGGPPLREWRFEKSVADILG